MARKKDIDLQGYKRDYEAGMSGVDLAANYGINKTNISTWARKAGAKIRIIGGRGPAASPGNPAGKRSEIASAGGNFHRGHKAGAADTATIHLSAAALDALWNDLDLDVKAECIEKILGN
jgi:uncharacterized protein YjcR